MSGRKLKEDDGNIRVRDIFGGKCGAHGFLTNGLDLPREDRAVGLKPQRLCLYWEGVKQYLSNERNLIARTNPDELPIIKRRKTRIGKGRERKNRERERGIFKTRKKRRLELCLTELGFLSTVFGAALSSLCISDFSSIAISVRTDRATFSYFVEIAKLRISALL